jgi:hypothetical protein
MLNEGLDFKALKGVLKPTLHIDEFSSKMGGDDEVVVLSFSVTNENAAKDLVSWFEKGYDFILDGDRSPGEIAPNTHLVFVEVKRRNSLVDNIETLLDDLQTLSEHQVDDWRLKVKEEKFNYSKDKIQHLVPLSPRAYRFETELGLNEMRKRSGIKEKLLYPKDKQDSAIKHYKGLAGL